MPKTPTWTYILRRICVQENCQAQVVVIQWPEELTGPQVRERLEQLTHYPAEEFEEVHQEPETAIVLDTWEQAIENMKPGDMDWHAVSTYRHWWKQEMLDAEARY